MAKMRARRMLDTVAVPEEGVDVERALRRLIERSPCLNGFASFVSRYSSSYPCHACESQTF